ncbi:ABC transporter ATP-binding protein [Streptomyces solicathayae]|uniref:ABC transporter ATP-binding protein n=1 Tax=Streptomyces solicathayae TaxID=3081768 RepID=A0ABZ0LXS6_9ACTN|nr:ABC transporter ATP-binding protein [Streptomyces sp. HUAS YS2]WOX24323.1 ABC transporter ATP-binding protein [Streptomyces sp. HUAS YS2]
MTASLTLDVSGLTCEAGGRTLLRDVALTARAGESLAVTGPSGSGKSTLLAVLAGLRPPRSGTVRVCGTDTATLRPAKAAAWRLRTIGFVYQFGELLPELSAIENAALPLLIGGTGRAQAYGTAGRLLDELGVGKVADSPADVLSGGERQRVAVARALSTRPPLIVADEPTGALDEQATDDVCELLFSLPERYGTTVLTVTHNPLVAVHADRRLHLRDGRLEELTEARAEAEAPDAARSEVSEPASAEAEA